MKHLTSTDENLVTAARDVSIAMTKLYVAINEITDPVGRLLALLDNRDGAETLGTVRGEMGFQLVKSVSSAYGELADFLRTAADDPKS